MDYTIRVGGEAGQGLLSIGNALSKTLSRYGFHVFTHQDYMSRIKGGHNFYQIRFADAPIAASRAQLDVLLALDIHTIELHRQNLNAGGKIVYHRAEFGSRGVIHSMEMRYPADLRRHYDLMASRIADSLIGP